MRQIELTFNVSGSCSQIIKLRDDCLLTDDEIIAGLNGIGHTICTTVQEDNDLIEITGQGEFVVIGRVVEVSMDAEYTDFTKDS